MTDYDIRQVGDTATLSLAGTDEVLGTVSGEGSSWRAVALDHAELGEHRSRADAADAVLADWGHRFEGATVPSPTSTMALARELHRRREHVSPARTQRSWLCDCNRDASELNQTQWLRDVVETLGGTFPKERPGG